MAGKPKLYYFNGRGRMESIRWLLAAAGIELGVGYFSTTFHIGAVVCSETPSVTRGQKLFLSAILLGGIEGFIEQFVEEFLETREQYEKLLQDGALLFQQVPMVEIDGMKMVQTRAILGYIAAKHNLYGKDLKERALIDMYVEGTRDLIDLIRVHHKFSPEEQEKNLALINERATARYFPVYEKVLKDHGTEFLVGNQLTWADVQLIEAILMVEEKVSTVLSKFPLLQDFKTRICNIPTIKKFLQPGSQRKPPPDESYVVTANRVFNRK